ncbi:SDR family oxidoreductase [Arthrobacter psychrochitiniphilus]|uniref:SDR family oxidoreductase n=1 Tax=Arthrobacter psychrochitiniphilus TaxID=291045 RepID=UPI003F7B5B1D
MNTQKPAAKVMVITGAGSGIGRAVARRAIAEGYNVVLAGRRSAELAESVPSAPNALLVPTDVTDVDAVRALFERAVEHFGRVDVLFNNAGMFGPSGAVDEISLTGWNDTLAVNLTGSMLCAAQAVRTMKSQTPHGGRIINNGSISAHSPRPKSVAYTVSKHAISGLTKSIELDGRAYGISCGQIDIGNTATDIMNELDVATGALQANGSLLVEPMFPVEEAARTVLFMAGLPASATIGQLVITAAGMPFVGRG